MRKLQNIVLIFALLFVACSANDTEADDTQQKIQNLSLDIQDLCETIPKKYYYFKSKKTDWPGACQRAQDELVNTATSTERLAVLERLVETLYDPHMTLGVNSASSPQLIPSGMDLAAEFKNDWLTITGIRSNSPAASSDLVMRDVILSINDVEIKDAINQRIGGEPVDDQHLRWAVQAVLAGFHNQSRKIEYMRGGVTRTTTLEPYKQQSRDSLVRSSQIEDIGIIRFNNSLGQTKSVAEVRRALANMPDINGIIIDLRDTPSGGNTSVAEPILGMFIDKSSPYQETVYADGRSQLAYPRGNLIYNKDKPVIVLVGRWTGSMGEGMAIGFDATGRARVLGDRMAGLAGGTEDFHLKRTNVRIAYPTYDLRHINGTPRHQWQVATPRPANFGSGIDMLLSDAIQMLSE